MEKNIEIFRLLAEEFKKHGHSLFLVGGTVRDYLLKKELKDMDVVSEATPEELHEFLFTADYTFEKYGSVKLLYEGVKFDITTLRKESGYLDSRHPNKVCFTKSLKEDVFRRDLTVNALYMDEELKVIDFVGGQKDLNAHLLRMIGDCKKRIEEDPLRIIRTLRFSLELSFKIDEELKETINNNFSLLKKINVEKIKQELRKSNHQEELKEIIEKHGIKIDL